MKFTIAALILISALSMWVCADSRFRHNYALQQINAVEFDAFGKVDIRQGKHNQLVLTAAEDITEHLLVQVDDKKLLVRDARTDSVWYQTKQLWKLVTGQEYAIEDVNYELTVSDLDNIALNGYFNARIHHLESAELSITFNGVGTLATDHLKQEKIAITANGNINNQLNTISANALAFTMNGLGDVEMRNIYSNQASITLNGMLDCSLSGHSQHLVLQMEGRGNCMGQDFSADFAQVMLKGISELTLTVNHELNAQTAKDSKVNYYGKPKLIAKGANVSRLAGGYQSKVYY